MQYLEIAGRTYALRFTARSLLRLQQLTDAPFASLFAGDEHGVCLLLYGALCHNLPALTLRQAQSLFAAIREQLPVLYDKLALAYDESGFPRKGVTPRQMERLMDAAARAGYAHSHRLCDLTCTEIAREIEAHLSRRTGACAAPMTDQQMRAALESFARRCSHAQS